MATSDSFEDSFEDSLDMIPEGTQATEHHVTYSTGYPDGYDLSGDVQELSHCEGFITAQLRGKFEGGLQSTSAPYHKQISDVAAQLNISVKRVRDFIGNERYRRKRKNNFKEKPPSKIRSATGYNLFVGDFMKSDEGKSIPDISMRNRLAARKWHNLDLESQLNYNSLALEKLKKSTESWKETRRILENLKENCLWAEKVGVHLCFMLVHKDNPYVGGTASGQEWLDKNPSLPLSFLSSSSKYIVPLPPKPRNKKELAEEVRKLLNNKYALAINNPRGRVPYSALQASNVILNGTTYHLKPPSLLTMEELQHVRNNIDHLQFVGVPPMTLTTVRHDHTYANDSDAPVMDKQQHTGSTILSSINNEAVPLL